MQQDILQ